eukprot:TRINITY_DN101784_c0_g1_i1.p1 TRINITY_DN101784_c0_g1~~TRINITY_DN101784_c0_g1_i1.p1  ORF type:complete len:733 (+),score=198.96 TRINITY_DN101784_c0_g1_i1:96-2294(+)
MASKGSEDRRKELLNLVCEVKARLEGKVDSLSFPIPQFVVIGKQSVGKSRLIEGLAGEPFNFVSGTLGSRRPTVLEFRNVVGLKPSKWSIRHEDGSWKNHSVNEVMQIVGKAHDSLGANVTDVPIRIKVEGEECVDLGLVDLPGFRSYAKDASKQDLSGKIEKMVKKFMQDENNVMICVEESGDAAGFSTLHKCQEIDPSFRRTILVRNKLDKYYNDLTNENVNKWLEGFGDLSPNLKRFSVSLPHWTSEQPPKPFGTLRTECAQRDVSTIMSKGASEKYRETVGFDNFRMFMEDKVQKLFAQALAPLLTRLKMLQGETENKLQLIETEKETINEDNILHATRSAGITFAQSFNYLMEGALSSSTNRTTMADELRKFHAWCDATDALKPDERLPQGFATLDDYLKYLEEPVRLQGMGVELNGGAQFRRLIFEVEVFTRFAGLADEINRHDIIQARGSGLGGSTTDWKGVVEQLTMKTAPKHMVAKTKYVGERLKWFFIEQKEATVQFMLQLKGSPEEHMFSRRMYKQGEVIERNNVMKACIFEAYDKACAKHKAHFMKLWDDFMHSMFQAPLMLLKSCSMPPIRSDESYVDEVAPTFDTTKQRIEDERRERGSMSQKLQELLAKIPNDDSMASQAATMIQDVIQKTFSAIRCVVADQMQLYSESFFLLPMLRRLEGEMANLELRKEDADKYRARSEVLKQEQTTSTGTLTDLQWCINAIEKFKVTTASESSA